MDLDRISRDRLDTLSRLAGETDLAVLILDLARTAEAAVPSFLALRVTMPGAGHPITVATRGSSAGMGVVRSSLRLETASAGEADHRLSMVYLAEQACAFIDFATLPPRALGPGDTLFGIRPEKVVVDGDLPARGMTAIATEDPGQIGEDADQSLIERAVGALMEYGFSPEQARRELAMWADSSHGTTLEEAQGLLLSLRRTAPLDENLESTSHPRRSHTGER